MRDTRAGHGIGASELELPFVRWGLADCPGRAVLAEGGGPLIQTPCSGRLGLRTPCAGDLEPGLEAWKDLVIRDLGSGGISYRLERIGCEKVFIATVDLHSPSMIATSCTVPTILSLVLLGLIVPRLCRAVRQDLRELIDPVELMLEARVVEERTEVEPIVIGAVLFLDPVSCCRAPPIGTR